MSWFTHIVDWFKHFWSKARPGLQEFLPKYEQLAVDEVRRLFTAHDGAGLHSWWDEAFAAVKGEIAKDLPSVADNWITIIISLAYEAIKFELATKNPA